MSMKFPEYKKFDLSEINKEINAFWKEQGIFEKSVDTRKGQPTFVFNEGPPSANGIPGIHHVMARTIKDIFCRYKTQQGYLVKRKAGWDTHGLPVELAVESAKGITKEDIGVTHMAQEFADSDTLGKAVAKVFKYVGLEKMDSIGKESLINASFDKYQSMAKKTPAKLKQEIKGPPPKKAKPYQRGNIMPG